MSKSNKLPKNITRRNGELYVTKSYRGQRLSRSLHTKNMDLARKRAAEYIKDFIKAIDEDVWEGMDRKAARRQFPTVGEVLDHYRTFAAFQGVSQATVAGYIAKLRRSLEALGHSRWESAGTELLTADLADDLIEHWLIKRAPDIDKDLRVHQATVNMVQSQLRNAASIFSRKALKHYERKGLKLPRTILEFGPSASYRERVKTYSLPPLDLVKATLEAGYELPDPLWLVFVGCFDLACRGDDLASARIDWFVQDGEGNRYLEVPGHMTKGKSLHRKPCPPALYAALCRKVGEREHILPGESYTARLELVQRGTFRLWMRELGWRTHKLAHELRALRACYVYFHGGGPVAAKQLLGHSTIATTEKHYAGALGIPPELHDWFTYWNTPVIEDKKQKA